MSNAYLCKVSYIFVLSVFFILSAV